MTADYKSDGCKHLRPESAEEAGGPLAEGMKRSKRTFLMRNKVGRSSFVRTCAALLNEHWRNSGLINAARGLMDASASVGDRISLNSCAVLMTTNSR